MARVWIMLTIVCWLAMIQAYDVLVAIYLILTNENPTTDSCHRP